MNLWTYKSDKQVTTHDEVTVKDIFEVKVM